MTKLPRITQRIFGDTAIQDNAIAQFGSVVAQNPLFTGDIKQIQALDYWSKGWVGATVTARRYPTAEETTGINKVVTQQLAYIFQEGIPEYDTGTTYPKGGWCKGLSAGTTTIYESLEDDNINNPLTDATKWKVVEFSGSSGSLEVCDIGIALYVDETKGLRRYLNGQIVDINENTQAFLNRLKKITTLHPSLLCTEDEWQTTKTMSVFGQVGKFVFNYSGETVVSVRIPRVVNVQGLFDLQNLGMTVSAGLPTLTTNSTGEHTHTRGTMEISGAFQVGGDTGARPQSGSSRANGAFNITGTSGNANTFENTGSGQTVVNSYDFYASRSWTGSTSSDGAHTHTIEGTSNTVQQEAIQYPYFIQIATGSETKNNIVNDIELNNPYSLFDSKYSDHELNNLSWLKSEGQWNAKATYPTAYDKLLKIYNGTEAVEGLSVKLSTETYTDYDFVLNTADETFRLPLKNHTADDGNSVLILYYYVGETVQNANLINAGRIGEQLAIKTDMLQASGAGMPSNKYIDLTLGANDSKYTAPANGYFSVGGNFGNINGYFSLALCSNVIGPYFLVSEAKASNGSYSCFCYIPAKKGDIVIVSYNYSPFSSTASGTPFFRFVYAEGEV